MDDDHHQQQRATTGATVVSRTLGSGRGLVARIPHLGRGPHPLLGHCISTANAHSSPLPIGPLSAAPAQNDQMHMRRYRGVFPLLRPQLPIGVSAPVSLQRIFAAAMPFYSACPPTAFLALHRSASHRIRPPPELFHFLSLDV